MKKYGKRLIGISHRQVIENSLLEKQATFLGMDYISVFLQPGKGSYGYEGYGREDTCSAKFMASKDISIAKGDGVYIDAPSAGRPDFEVTGIMDYPRHREVTIERKLY